MRTTFLLLAMLGTFSFGQSIEGHEPIPSIDRVVTYKVTPEVKFGELDLSVDYIEMVEYFDGNGRRTRRDDYVQSSSSATGSRLSRITYWDFDAEGRISASETYRASDDSLYSRSVFTYLGDTYKEETYKVPIRRGATEFELSTVSVTELDGHGNEVKVSSYHANGDLMFVKVYEYDHLNRLVSSVSYNESGVVDSKSTYDQHDEHGNYTRYTYESASPYAKGLVGTYIVKTLYDDYGNWVERVTFMEVRGFGGVVLEPRYATRREITYRR